MKSSRCLTLLSCLAVQACARTPKDPSTEGAPDGAPFTCELATTARQPALDVPAGFLWAKPLVPPLAGVQGSVVEAEAGVLGLVVGPHLLVVDGDGGRLAQWTHPRGVSLSSPTSDGKGNFYLASDGAFSVDKQGQTRWSAGLGGTTSRFLAPNPPVTTPDGHVYVAHPNGVVMALKQSDGTMVWLLQPEVPDARTGFNPVTIAAALEDVLLVGIDGGAATLIVDRSTGAVRRVSPRRGFTGSLPQVGVKGLGAMLTEYNQGGRTTRVVGLDGQDRWSLPSRPWLPAVAARWVDHSGHLAFWEAHIPGGARADQLSFRDCRGNLIRQGAVAGPSGQWFGAGFVLGSDGTVYARTSPNADVTGAGFFVVAIDPELSVRWAIESRDARPAVQGSHSPLLLTRSGVLYFLRVLANGSGELVAIQTQSAGPAATPWSGGAFDNAATGWAP